MVMGVRATTLGRSQTLKYYFYEILFMILSCLVMTSFGENLTEAEALMKVKDSLALNDNGLSSWEPNTSPCNQNMPNWFGVICVNGKIRGLKLENMGLKGNLVVDSLDSLPSLRSLSFMNNTLVGSLPNFRRLRRLRAIYLSYNYLSGVIPDDAFMGLHLLKKLYLSNNQFTGKIPSSLVELSELMVLKIDGNKFEGKIPDFLQESLKSINVSNNKLEGPIPPSLARMSPTAFVGNKNICGAPLAPCSSPPISLSNNMTTPTVKVDQLRKSKSHLNKVLIVIIILLILTAIASALIIAHFNRTTSSEIETDHMKSDFHKSSINIGLSPQTMFSPSISKKVEQGNNLTFVGKDRNKFDMDDLLRASAEILGSGTFGSSYKAIIVTDVVVVKRYKQMNNVGREEFHEHMTRLGSVVHPNLTPLVAYHYRREEKLLITDYVDNGSLASHLHGNEQELDWHARLRIVKGIARGLTCLYTMLPNLVVPHGHLKSSNVLLDESFEPLLTDYALLPMINLDHAQHLMMAYKSPEYAKTGRITKKTDLWCLGILILEMLTGKFPENYFQQKYNPNADLAYWVNAMIKEKRTSEVLDFQIDGYRNSKGEMLKLLKIGLSCCEEDLESRLDLEEAVERIEMLNEGETDISYFEFENASRG